MVCSTAEICVSWGRQLLPALPDFGPEHPNSRLRETSCRPIITEHFATISSGCGGALARSAVMTSSVFGRAAARRAPSDDWGRPSPWHTHRSPCDAVGPIPAKEDMMG